jgi:hypothetical protein
VVFKVPGSLTVLNEIWVIAAIEVQMWSEASPQVAARLLGMLHTTWMPFEDFSAAYWHDGPASVGAQESALCFREVMQRAKQD